MIKKILELAKSNPKISDLHLRGGTNIAYREMGDIVIEKNSRVESKDIEELLILILKKLSMNNLFYFTKNQKLLQQN